MNTLDFFSTILPSEGTYYLALLDDNTKKVAHKAYSDLPTLAKAVEAYDKIPNISVYHACASFKEPYVVVDGKKKYRIDENCFKAKAFWLDIDCGKSKADKCEGYLTKKDAFVALKGFCEHTGLPLPLVVDSGNGLHCYWPLTKGIGKKSWSQVATHLKAALRQQGILSDPTATADFARILRPVGTQNKKDKDNFKVVTNKNTVIPLEPEEFVKKLSTIAISQKQPVAFDASLNADLTAHLAPPLPAYAEKVAQRCQQVAKMRDTQGDVGYEHWRGVIGIIYHCEEGVELAHSWSAQRAQTGHEQTDVDTKYNTWGSGATTCEFFSHANPGGCDGCVYSGKIKSPIVLGREIAEVESQTVAATVDGVSVTIEIPAMPSGYGHENGVMVRYIKDKDDIWHSFHFCQNIFYPIYRIRKESGEFSITIRMHLPDNRTRDFDIDTTLLASAQKLIEGLAKYELLPTNNKDAAMHITAYLRDSVEKLKREVDEINTLTHFGWRDDMRSFLIGDRLIMENGTVRRALVGGYARDKCPAFPPPQGTKEGYAQALNFLYARQGMEPMQYAIASAFGSILTPLAETMFKGLLVALVGGETARGKTTVCLLSLYAFGDAERMKISKEDGATGNARNALLGTYKNIPILLDELTHIDPKEFSKLAYTISNGQERERLTVGKGTGTRFADSQTWAMSPFATANTDLHNLLALEQSNSQAEAVRLIQINIDQYNMPKLAISEVEACKRQIELNKGSAGDEYLRYVVTHKNDVLTMMGDIGKRLEEEIPDQKFRFYRNHAICALTAIRITNQLGITDFDYDSLLTFSVALLKELAERVIQQNMLTPEDAINQMINDLSGHIIVTNEYRDARNPKGPEEHRPVQTPIAGRYIIGAGTVAEPMAGKLFLRVKAVYDWCLANRIDVQTVRKFGMDSGLLEESEGKITLGRGVRQNTGNHRCYIIDMHKLEGLVAKPVLAASSQENAVSIAEAV